MSESSPATAALASETERAARVWLILPTYNEAPNIERLVDQLLERLPESRRILIVDDSSPDGTGQIADRLAQEREDVEVLHQGHKGGLGPACLAGFHLALMRGADLVIEMDADFSHDPKYVPELLRAADDADLVLGSRYVPGGGVTKWGIMRRLLSRSGNAYARTVLGTPIRDLTGGFKCYRRGALEAIELDTFSSRGYIFQVETTFRAMRAGLRIVEVPILFREREEGSSKMTQRIIFEAMWRVLSMRMRRPSRTRAYVDPVPAPLPAMSGAGSDGTEDRRNGGRAP